MTGFRVFYSYSHADAKYRQQLEAHLSVLRRQGLIDEWYDRRILAGQDWANEIDLRLEQSRIVLLLISAYFIASEYCYGKEMKRAIELHEEGLAVVIPVIVRSVDWRGLPFSRLQALPPDGRPVAERHNQDKAWAEIVQGIRDVVGRLQQRVGV